MHAKKKMFGKKEMERNKGLKRDKRKNQIEKVQLLKHLEFQILLTRKKA